MTPVIKHPCLQCKEKHVKCDEEQPKCRRCQSKQLPCSRPARKTVFKHGSIAQFAKDQKWRGGIASMAPQERAHQQQTPPNSGRVDRMSPSLVDPGADAGIRPCSAGGFPGRNRCDSPLSGRPMHHHHHHHLQHHQQHQHHRRPLSRAGSQEGATFTPSGHTATSTNTGSTITSEPAFPFRAESPMPPPPAAATAMPTIAYLTSPGSYSAPRFQHERGRSESSAATASRTGLESHSSALSHPDASPASSSSGSFSGPSPAISSSIVMQASLVPAEDSDCRPFPLRDVQEACLLRYFIEEMSHWFDLCDEHRHFQLVVPVRARRYPHLLDAIFAVAARHLSRLPQYKTPKGILYHGQLLPNLNEHAAVEYMLRCIPALRQFNDNHDDDYRDSIIATAVILRQLEEIDHDDDLQREPLQRPVNFLAIIDAVLRSLPSRTTFGQHGLMQAAYWMALRQEIFNSFTRREAPQLIMPSEFWSSASGPNKIVMHLVQTAKWHWGAGGEQEWVRLVKQQEQLEQQVLVNSSPLYQRGADKSRGEIFPTIWYGSNIEVTSIQLGLIAKAVLVAENPGLRNPMASRASWRRAENEVRVLLFDLCGVALCNPASPPALVQAALGIGVYSDFFTDPYERSAIRAVIERYRETHAWPVDRLLAMFQ